VTAAGGRGVAPNSSEANVGLDGGASTPTGSCDWSMEGSFNHVSRSMEAPQGGRRWHLVFSAFLDLWP
jgi:hypothetical protein